MINYHSANLQSSFNLFLPKLTKDIVTTQDLPQSRMSFSLPEFGLIIRFTGVKVLNSIDDQLKTLKKAAFKKKLKDGLIASYIYKVLSLILSGKNILQELLSRELTAMRHVSFIQNLDNLNAYLYSNRQSSNFLTNEIQSNLNLLQNGSYAAKSIECSNYKQGRTFSFIKQVLNKII